MGRQRVYIDTTIISYLAPSPSMDVLTPARQKRSWHWWLHRHERFDLVISETVVDELACGERDPTVHRQSLVDQRFRKEGSRALS